MDFLKDIVNSLFFKIRNVNRISGNLNNNNLDCKKCNKKLTSLKRLKNHVKKRHANLKCLKCGRFYTNCSDLKNHKTKCDLVKNIATFEDFQFIEDINFNDNYWFDPRGESGTYLETFVNYRNGKYCVNHPYGKGNVRNVVRYFINTQCQGKNVISANMKPHELFERIKTSDNKKTIVFVLKNLQKTYEDVLLNHNYDVRPTNNGVWYIFN